MQYLGVMLHAFITPKYLEPQCGFGKFYLGGMQMLVSGELQEGAI